MYISYKIHSCFKSFWYISSILVWHSCIIEREITFCMTTYLKYKSAKGGGRDKMENVFLGTWKKRLACFDVFYKRSSLNERYLTGKQLEITRKESYVPLTECSKESITLKIELYEYYLKSNKQTPLRDISFPSDSKSYVWIII